MFVCYDRSIRSEDPPFTGPSDINNTVAGTLRVHTNPLYLLQCVQQCLTVLCLINSRTHLGNRKWLTRCELAFMLIRGPHAYLGWSWVSCSGDCFSKKCPAPPGNQIHYDFTLGGLTDVDYGEPIEVCHETSAGSAVFVREWTKATVTVNCSEWSSSITPKANGMTLQEEDKKP